MGAFYLPKGLLETSDKNKIRKKFNSPYLDCDGRVGSQVVE